MLRICSYAISLSVEKHQHFHMDDMTMWLIIADWIWQINNKSHSVYVWPISGKTTTTNKNNAHTTYATNEISWSRLFHAIELWIVDVFNSISLCCRDVRLFRSRSPIITRICIFFQRKIHSTLLIYSRFRTIVMQYRTKHYRISSLFTQCVGDQTAIFTFYASFLWAIFVGRCYLMDV